MAKLGLMALQYGFELQHSDFLNVYVQIALELDEEYEDDLFEHTMIWGRIGRVRIKFEEDAVKKAIKFLKDTFRFEVDDHNYEDKEYYKYQYRRINQLMMILMSNIEP